MKSERIQLTLQFHADLEVKKVGDLRMMPDSRTFHNELCSMNVDQYGDDAECEPMLSIVLDSGKLPEPSTVIL